MNGCKSLGQARHRPRRTLARGRSEEEEQKPMRGATKLAVRRQTAPRVERTAEELAELRQTRERFQREKPTLDQVLAATGQEEATTLGECLQAQELLLGPRRERERQKVTLAQLAEKTGYDPAVL